MKGKFMAGMIAGGLLGASLSMYSSSMSPRQRKRMMNKGKKAITNVMDSMH